MASGISGERSEGVRGPVKCRTGGGRWGGVDEERSMTSSKIGGSSVGRGARGRGREEASEGEGNATAAEEKENAGELHWPCIDDRLEVKKNLGLQLGWQVFV